MHDLGGRPSQSHLSNNVILQVNLHQDIAFPAHLNTLGDLILDGAIPLVTRVESQVGPQGAGGAASGGIFKGACHHARAEDDLAGALVEDDIVEAADEAVREPGVDEPILGELGGAEGDLGEELEAGEGHEDEGQAVDKAEDGGAQLGLANLGHGGQVAGGEGGEAPECGLVEVDVVRDGCLDGAEGRLGEGDGAGLCDQGGDAPGQQRDGGADGWVAGKGHLLVGQEDLNVPPLPAVAAAGALVIPTGVFLVDEDGLAQVELTGDGLLLLGGGFGKGALRDCDDSEGVPLEALPGEDVKRDEWEFQAHRAGAVARDACDSLAEVQGGLRSSAASQVPGTTDSVEFGSAGWARKDCAPK